MNDETMRPADKMTAAEWLSGGASGVHTLRPADRMTAEEWRAARDERLRREALYDALAARLAWFAEHPHANCQSCFRRYEIATMVNGLCRGCSAWAASYEMKLAEARDRAAVRRALRENAERRLVQKAEEEFMKSVAADLLGMLDLLPRASSELHRFSLRAFEEAQWSSRIGGSTC